MSMLSNEESLDPKKFKLWIPTPDQTVKVGPEQTPVPLPQMPLPVHPEALEAGDPSDDAIGNGLYDYLREFPDCLRNRSYAELLQEAYPHFLADLGAQILMLDHKEVDSSYIRRKITYMKILALLDGDNVGLLQRLGIEYYNLGQMFSEFSDCRAHLLKSMNYFHEVLKRAPNHPTALNYLGQIDYLFGDFPSAADRWQQVVEQIDEGPAKQALQEKIAQVKKEGEPVSSLVEDYEAIGAAMVLYGQGEFDEAATTLDIVEDRGRFPTEMPSPEFYYMLGICRSKNGDQGGAFEALEKALELDPDYAPAVEARERIFSDGKA